MRGSNVQGRFNIDYEGKSMYEAIAEDVGGTVGVEVDWFRWQTEYFQENYTTIVDHIYDVGSSADGGGRRWERPFKMPAVMAQLIRSTNVMNPRGFYVTDTLRLVLNSGDAMRLLPSLLTDPSSHIKDRVVYRGEVFVPTRVLPRGSFGNRYSVVTVDLNQLNDEELVNDPQFQRFATKAVADVRPNPYGYGNNGYADNPYGA